MSGREVVEERPQRRREWSGALRSLVLPLLILAAIVGGLWWWEQRDSGSSFDDARYGIVELPAVLNSTGDAPSSDVGRAAPDFLLEGLNASELRLSDLQGTPVVVNFWASWCPPCREELPVLAEAYGRRQQDFTVIAVNLQEADSQVRSFVDDYGLTFPVVIDRDSEVAEAWDINGPISGLPTSYFIDEHGVVSDVFYGPLTERDLDERLEALLSGEAS
jgi:peroxiredoxin